jgi:hypothetical protein
MAKRFEFTAEQLEKHYRVNAPVDDHHGAFHVRAVDFIDDGVKVTLEPDNSIIKDSVFLNRGDIEALLARYVRKMWFWPEIEVEWTDSGSENDRRRGEDYRLFRTAKILSLSEKLIQERKHA